MIFPERLVVDSPEYEGARFKFKLKLLNSRFIRDGDVVDLIKHNLTSYECKRAVNIRTSIPRFSEYVD